MEDFAGRLGALLSDPAAMQDLADLAAMLRETEGNAPETPDARPSGSGNAADAANSGAPGSGWERPPERQEGAANTGSAPDSPEALPDFGKLLAIGQLLGQQQEDANTALLAALKPHLSPARAERAEKAIKLLRLYQIIGVLRESGMLSSLL